MVKLTPELVSKAGSHMNPLKERELEFRGMGIATIENLGVFQGGYDCLNMSDNAITSVGNLPLSTRLRSIILANNSISSISPSISISVPNLTTLTLTGNSIASLGALLPLEQCRNLRYLNLGGNAVREEPHYREFCIWKVASGNLHVLDFRRIKDTERSTATSLFLTAPPASQPTALALSILESSPVVAAPAASSAGEVTKKAGRLMGEDEKQKIREAIARAGSVEEVRALERMLAEGFVPEKESTGKGKAAAKTVE